MTARKLWRVWWRARRIMIRECCKATDDAVIFGTSFVKHGAGGTWQRDGSDIAQRIAPSSVYAGD